MYLFIIDCVLITISVLLCIVITTTFICDKELRQLPSNRFLVNFVIADFLVASGAFVLVFYGKETDRDVAPKKFLVTSTYFVVAITSYWLGLMIVTMDRYFAVLHPLLYSSRMNYSISCRVILCFWIFVVVFACSCLSISILSHADFNAVSKTLLVFLLVITFIGIGLLLFVNILVFREVRRQVNRLVSISVGNSGETQRTLRKREAKAAYLCFAMAATFIICWLPHSVITILTMSDFKMAEPQIILKATTSLFHVNLVVNPILYVFCKSDVRNSARNLFLARKNPQKLFGTRAKMSSISCAMEKGIEK